MRVAAALAVFASLVPQSPAATVTRIAPVAESQRSAEQRSLAARFSASGMPNAVATYLNHPVLAEQILPYAIYVSNDSKLPPRHRALVGLRTAWLTRSNYLWGHQAVLAHRAGLTGEELERIAQGPDAKGWDAFEAALLRSADELHVDSFISDPTWNALSARYDVNQMIDLVYGVGDITMHAGVFNSIGIEMEPDVPDRLPSGIPYVVAAKRTNVRLIGQQPRIPPLEPADWTPELRQRIDPTGSGRPVGNVFRTFVRNPPADRLRGGVTGHIRNSTTLSPRYRELLLMRIGILCRSEYEWAAHSRAGRGAGMTEADVARIVAGPGSGETAGDPVEPSLLKATDELYRDDAVSAGTWAALAAALDSKQLLDVLISVGGYRTASMAINSAGVQLDANMANFRFPPALR